MKETTREVSVPMDEMQSLIGRLLEQRLIAGGLKRSTNGAKATFLVAVELEIESPSLTMRRLGDGTCLFTQTLREQVTARADSFMGEFNAMRDKAITNAPE